MALAALPKSLLGPHDTIGSTLLHCESEPTRNICHFQSMGPLKNSGCFHVFLIGGLTWAFPISLIKLHYGFSRLLRQCMRHGLGIENDVAGVTSGRGHVWSCGILQAGNLTQT